MRDINKVVTSIVMIDVLVNTLLNRLYKEDDRTLETLPSLNLRQDKWEHQGS